MILAAVASCPSSRASDPATAWQLLDDGDPNQGPQNLVFDTRSGTTVLFNNGGNNQVYRMWSLSGDEWTRWFPPPAAQNRPICVAYDRSRQLIVVYSDIAPNTWEYDGTTWHGRVTATVPTPRWFCSMSFDERRNKIVMFGGYDPALGTQIDDTWEYDGTNWTRILTPTRPNRRDSAGIAYDAQRQVVVLFGGYRSGGVLYNDLWEYNGASWTLRNPVGQKPAARFGMGMTYDRVRRRTVVFGGATSSQQYGDTWEWNGTSWSKMNPSTSPSARQDCRMTFDETRGTVVLYDGTAGEQDFGDTWTYDGATWIRIALGNRPPPLTLHGVAYDPTTKKVVLYGGGNFSLVPQTDTWRWSHDLGWERSGSSARPMSTSWARLGWNATSQRIESFGGGAWTRELFRYDGALDQWSSLGMQPPYARIRHAWNAAPALGGVLLFGGLAGETGQVDSYVSNDTWLYDGSLWTQYQPLTRPAERVDPALAEFGDGRTYLYGGMNRNEVKFADFWRFDGVDWERLTDSAPPGPRGGGAMVHDPERGRLVLIAGGPTAEGKVWEYDGTGWTAQPQSFEPDTDRCGMQAVWYPPKSVVLLIGGRTCGTVLIDANDVWAYGPDPDQDGKVGGFDNCATVVNVEQQNGDGDVAGDACDCAPADGTAYAVPPAVTGVSWTSKTRLQWTSAVLSAGSGTLHDVRRGVLGAWPPGNGGAVESCLFSGAASETDEPAMPNAGTGFWYLVRGRNACGAGTWGTDSSGAARAPGGCP